MKHFFDVKIIFPLQNTRRKCTLTYKLKPSASLEVALRHKMSHNLVVLHQCIKFISFNLVWLISKKISIEENSGQEFEKKKPKKNK